MRVVLASASPRRTDLLRLIGVHHEVVPMHVDERIFDNELPHVYVDRVACLKAESYPLVSGDHTLVIAADTTVVIDGVILSKPADAADAFRMLRLLSGRTHSVFTAVAVRYSGIIESAVEQVEVTFRHLSDEEIVAYVATGEPMDKAGSYGIQGFGATIVEGVDGDFFAVMGLPLVRMVKLLKKVGINYRFGPLN